MLFDSFSHFKLIDITRNLGSVIGSWARKNWLSNEKLNSSCYNSFPPFHDNKSVPLPYYIDDDKIDLWKKGNEIDRILELVINIAKNKLKILELIKKNYSDRVLEIKYEELIKNPEKKVNDIVLFLNAEKTDKTYKNINDIRDKTTKYDLEKLLRKCNKEVYDGLLYYNKKLGYKELQ